LTPTGKSDRAQGNLISLIVGVAIAAIVGIGVGIPIVNDVIAQADTSGILGTVLGFIPVMIALLVFIAAASPVMRST
jgi:hypothetical protein